MMGQSKAFGAGGAVVVRFLVGCVIFVMPMSLLATQSLMLYWDPSSGTGISGYKIYYGTASHQYDSTVAVGNVTQATVPGLVEGITYYFAATAYDDAGDESDFSNEKVFAVPVAATNQTSTSTSVPMASTLAAGQNVIFSIATKGMGAVNYQWKYNSHNIDSATNAALILNQVAATQAGTYYVIVSNGDGLTNTMAVSLSVYASVAAKLTQVGYANGQCSFNVSGVPGTSYVVQASTNLTDWVSVQTNAAPFLFIDSQSGQFKQRFYRAIYPGDVTISSTVCSTANATATVTLGQPGFTNGQYAFNVSGVPGHLYVVQASTNLKDWIPIQTNAAPFTFVDPQAGQFQQRFYRTVNNSDSNSIITLNATTYATAAAVLTQASYADGQYSFNISGMPGYSYVVQASTNLTDWVSVQTNAAPFTFMDSQAGQFQQRFYRAFWLPAP